MATDQSNEQKDGGQTALRERPQTSPPRVDRLPPWKVLLHNDDSNFMEDVIRALQEICKFNHTEALQRTLEAHQSGVSLLLVTHREHAELLREQFETKLLTVTIEPDHR